MLESHTDESDNLDPQDVDLVELAQQGDSKAFDKLVLRHNKRLYSLIYNMTQNREDTYDLLQDVFAKAYRSLRRFKGRSTFYTWIYTIAVNMTLNYLKKKKKKKTLSLDDQEGGFNASSAVIDSSSRINPRKEADLQLLQQKLNEALKKLSEQHRTVVVLFDIQGVPHAQISKILGVSEGTVRSRLFYAHRNLQSELEDFKKML